MNRATSWIEFHDSDLVAVRAIDSDIELVLDAYVHRWDQADGVRQGTGWMQPLRIVVSDAGTPGETVTVPVRIVEGRLLVGDVVHGSLVRLPLVARGPIRLRLLLTTGDVLDVAGSGIEIGVTGPAVYVEDLPADLEPDQ